jgi:uncharacterized membrane protein
MKYMSKWQWIIRQFTKKLWVRTSMFGVLSVLTALAALFFRDYIPEDTSRKIGADSVDSLLHIIASSMLAVTTFSLSIMVAAYSAASAHVTPRSTQLLLADNTSQNALSVFIGSFIFSIVSIIALTMGIYGDSGRLILFGVTVVVITIIVIVLIQWINYLSRLGRVNETIDLVERETARAICNQLKNPCMGGMPLGDNIPNDSACPLSSNKIGYIQHIDVETLDKLAQEYECSIYVKCLTGDFYDGIDPLLYSSHALGDENAQKLTAAFSIAGERSFAQDPRFGLVVLSEIASRALSPALNDPGTAIDIIGTGLRVLMPWVSHQGSAAEAKYPNVFVPPISMASLFNDFFTPIARDGAGIIEVGVHLQKALASLAAAGESHTIELARQHSVLAFKRAEKALAVQEDLKRLEQWVLG